MPEILMSRRAEARFEPGPRPSQITAEFHECVGENLRVVATDPSLGRVSPQVPYGWWSGLIFHFHCGEDSDPKYFTAFYLKTDDGIWVEDIGII